MSVYSQELLNDLQGYIDNAKAALVAGEARDALNYVNLYYQSQTDLRGYASDALQVVNNVGLFGATANQNIIDAIGLSQYNKIQPNLAVALAASDNLIVQSNGGTIPDRKRHCQLPLQHLQQF